MRRNNGIRSEEPGGPVSTPEERGWDDSLYRDRDRGAPDRGRDGGAVPPARTSGEGGREGGGARGPDGPGGQGTRGRRGKRAKKKKRPRWARVLIGVAATLAVLIVGVGVAGYLYIEHLNRNLTEKDLHLGDKQLEKPPPNAAGQTPMNILLLGSDARDSEENLALGGARDTAGNPPLADVQMLLHVAADRSNMTVISIPRDTRVTIPKCTDPETGEEYPQVDSDTINHSLQRGGPGCTVATWEELTGIPIDHFMMIDFAGVVSMADAVGGVPVCVNANVYDRKSGLRLEEGETVVKGEQALQWLRTRYGFEDGSDIGRAKAQHMYLSAMVRQLQSGTKLTDPAKLNSLANAATKALTVDPGLGDVFKLKALGEDLQRVPTERINMITMPWIQAPENPTAHVAPKPGAAEELFSMVREDLALDEEHPEQPGGEEEEPDEPAGPEAEPPGVIDVAVRNGTDSVSLGPVGGRAGAIAGELHALGFANAVVDERLLAQSTTVLQYPGGDDQARANAEAVAEALGIPADAVSGHAGADRITLIVGGDWREGNRFPENTVPKEPKKELDTSDALSGDDDSACMDVNPAHIW